MLTSLSAKLTGTPGTGGWAQVHEFSPEDPEKLLARGRLYAIVSTNRLEVAPGTLDTVSLGRELIARLHEEYFGDLSAKPFNALTGAVQKVTEEFKNSWGDVEIVASAIINDVVYSATSAGGRILICRDGAIGTILSGSGEIVSSSGFPKKDDMLLMATKSFFENVSQGVIKAALTTGSPESAIEVFAPGVHATGDLGGLGVIVLKFEEKSVFAVPFVNNQEINLPKAKLPDFGSKAKVFLDMFSKILPKKDVYVGEPINDEVTSQSKKLTFSVALILLGILVISIIFGIKQKKSNDLMGKYTLALTEASNEVDQAVGLASASPDKSRELFYDAEQKLASIEDLKVKDPKLDVLRQKIDQSRAAILGEYLEAPDMFMDLSLLASGFKGDAITSSGGNIYILDKGGKRIVSVAFDTKKSKVVAGPSQIDEADDFASYENRTFVLMADGIYEVGLNKSKLIDKTWSGNAFIKAFAGNMYVMDVSGNVIYRYQGQGNSFGDKGNWLAAGTNVNFSNAVSWVIDGSVYVLYPPSKILKYSQGSPQAFSLSGVVPEISQIDAIYADADNSDIYILDKAGKRVVVTDKKGKYIAQYIDDNIVNASNLVVSEADKKIILLIGDKLYSIDIKHL